MPIYRSLTVSLALSLSACAAAPPPPSMLPLQRMRLYETGVGYFERSGALPGQRKVSLPVPSGHLDDALKTLVVLGGERSVGQVAFESRLSPAVARARAGLPPATIEAVGFAAVLASLVGQRVELRAGARRVAGRLVDITTESIVAPESKSNRSNGASESRGAGQKSAKSAVADPGLVQRELAILLTDGGAFVRFEVARLTAIRPLDHKARTRYDEALVARAALAGNTRSQLDVLSDGADVTLGYLAETPVWRTSYRLVLAGSEDAATVSGWALVHNDTEEDWRDVAVELANGRPDSFLFPLAAPRYDRRELVTPDEELSSVPQLLSETPDAMWGDFVGGSLGLGGVGTVGHGSGSGSGYGYGSGRSGTISRKSGSSSLLEVGDLAKVAEAEGREAPTVFVYRSAEPLNLSAHRSALVPFLQKPVDASILTWFDKFRPATGRFALRFANSTRSTLPAGPLSVFADGGFAGELILHRLTPGQRQFATIGDDLDVELEIRDRTSTREPKRLVFANGSLQEHYLRTRTFKAVFRNRAGRTRHITVRVDARRNARIDGAQSVDFDKERAAPLARFTVPANTEEDIRAVRIVEGLVAFTRVEGLTAERMQALGTSESIVASERKVVADAAPLSAQLATRRRELADITKDIKTTEKDLKRLRGYLQAAAERSSGGDNPLIARVLATEDKLADLRRRERTGGDAVAAARTALAIALEPLAPPDK